KDFQRAVRVARLQGVFRLFDRPRPFVQVQDEFPRVDQVAKGGKHRALLAAAPRTAVPAGFARSAAELHKALERLFYRLPLLWSEASPLAGVTEVDGGMSAVEPALFFRAVEERSGLGGRGRNAVRTLGGQGNLGAHLSFCKPKPKAVGGVIRVTRGGRTGGLRPAFPTPFEKRPRVGLDILRPPVKADGAVDPVGGKLGLLLEERLHAGLRVPKLRISFKPGDCDALSAGDVRKLGRE